MLLTSQRSSGRPSAIWTGREISANSAPNVMGATAKESEGKYDGPLQGERSLEEN